MDTNADLLVISHNSALALLRLLRSNRSWQPTRMPAVDTYPLHPTDELVNAARERNVLVAALETPLHVLVGTRKNRRSRLAYTTHLQTVAPLADTYIKIEKTIYACGPELCLAQEAPRLGFGQLANLIMELCGTYNRLPDSSQTLYGCAPCTSVQRIQSFARTSRSLKGTSALLRACEFALDNSASPRESALVLLLCAPYCEGGYGLPLPQMNYRIATEASSPASVRRRDLFIDLCWPKHRLAVEYDSAEFHAADERLENDACRRDALVDLGYTHITVTREQLNNPDMTDKIARIVAQRLGCRIRIRSTKFESKQRALRRDLLNPHHA